MKFIMPGSFPTPWEDFVCEGEARNVTIVAGCSKETIEQDNSTYWWDIEITDSILTRERAVELLAQLCNVPAEEIEIEEIGTIQSI